MVYTYLKMLLHDRHDARQRRVFLPPAKLNKPSYDKPILLLEAWGIYKGAPPIPCNGTIPLKGTLAMNFITLKSFHEKMVFFLTIHPPRLGHIDMEELKETLEETWMVMAKVVVSPHMSTRWAQKTNSYTLGL